MQGSLTPQRKQLSFNILIISVLHTNQYAYGDKKLLYVKWKPKALRTGVGRSKMTCGKCFGQYFFGFWISLIYRFFTESGKNYKYILAVAIAATQSYANDYLEWRPS
jgi:hypothetical protein